MGQDHDCIFYCKVVGDDATVDEFLSDTGKWAGLFTGKSDALLPVIQSALRTKLDLPTRKGVALGDDAKPIDAAQDRAGDDDVREQLAAYAHAAWAGWTKYLFSKCVRHDDGSLTIPAELVQRWQRQIDTAYVDLPEHEKASDRTEADAMLAITNAQITAFVQRVNARAEQTIAKGMVSGAHWNAMREELALLNAKEGA